MQNNLEFSKEIECAKIKTDREEDFKRVILKQCKHIDLLCDSLFDSL